MKSHASQSQSLAGSVIGSQYNVAAADVDDEDTQGHNSQYGWPLSASEQNHSGSGGGGGDGPDVSYTMNDLTGEQEVVLTSHDDDVNRMVSGVLSRLVQVIGKENGVGE